MRLAATSVRLRLALWHAVTLAVIVLVFSAGIFYFVAETLYRDLDARLGGDLAALEKVRRAEPEELSELETQIGIAFFEVVDKGRLLHRTAGWVREGLSAAPLGNDPRSWTSDGGHAYRIAGRTGPNFRIVLALSEDPVRLTLGTLAAILSFGVPFVLGVSIAGGYFLAGRVLAPVGAMADKARRITADSLGERLPSANPDDEFGRLADVINDALARVQRSFDQLRRFAADASHELRTPLTAMRSVGEVAMQKTLDPAGYRDVIGSMLEEVERLTRIVENLLTITRAESGGIQPRVESVDLGVLVAEVANQLRVLADEKGQNLQLQVPRSLVVECDPAILRQSAMNVIHNAIKFTPAAGSIRVAVGKLSPGEAMIEISDSGPGIPEIHRSRIFDRFYRIDDGRSRDAGGVGLGLAIARWAAEANGGRIELDSREGTGSLFRIVLSA